MWGVVFALVLWLIGSGLSTGVSAMAGMANLTGVAASNTSQQGWEAGAKKAGVSEETIKEWRESAKEAPAKTSQELNDPANQRAAVDYATKASWWTLGGTLLSMAAAIIGGILGAGPTFRLFAATPSTGIRRPQTSAASM
jgi:hypothetical protein